MERLLFIVSQSRRELYESLRVVLGQERDRRARPLEDSEMLTRGWTVVRLP